MKILNISDVITNSSSEVFTYYTQESVNIVKELVNAILKAGGSDKTCDDLFDIRLSFDEDGFEVIPKDPNNAIAASFIAGIPFIFDTEAVFN